MKKKRFRFLVLLIALCMLFFPSCSGKYTYEQACEEFSQYGYANDVILLDGWTVCFRDRKIDLKEFFPGEEPGRFEAALINGRLYFTCFRKKNDQWVTTLYTCELRGENPQVVFEKTDCTADECTRIVGDIVYYYEWDSEKDKHVIKNFYKITTGYYGNGSQLAFSDIQSLRNDYQKYRIEQTETAFIITDKTTQETRVVDDAFLQATEYYDSLKKFDYRIGTYDIIDNVVLLSLLIDVRDVIDLFPIAHPLVIFEYDFEKNQLTFQLIGYPCELSGGWTARHNVVTE